MTHGVAVITLNNISQLQSDWNEYYASAYETGTTASITSGTYAGSNLPSGFSQANGDIILFKFPQLNVNYVSSSGAWTGSPTAFVYDNQAVYTYPTITNLASYQYQLIYGPGGKYITTHRNGIDYVMLRKHRYITPDANQDWGVQVFDGAGNRKFDSRCFNLNSNFEFTDYRTKSQMVAAYNSSNYRTLLTTDFNYYICVQHCFRVPYIEPQGPIQAVGSFNSGLSTTPHTLTSLNEGMSFNNNEWRGQDYLAGKIFTI